MKSNITLNKGAKAGAVATTALALLGWLVLTPVLLAQKAEIKMLIE